MIVLVIRVVQKNVKDLVVQLVHTNVVQELVKTSVQQDVQLLVQKIALGRVVILIVNLPAIAVLVQVVVLLQDVL